MEHSEKMLKFMLEVLPNAVHNTRQQLHFLYVPPGLGERVSLLQISQRTQGKYSTLVVLFAGFTSPNPYQLKVYRNILRRSRFEHLLRAVADHFGAADSDPEYLAKILKIQGVDLVIDDTRP